MLNSTWVKFFRYLTNSRGKIENFDQSSEKKANIIRQRRRRFSKIRKLLIVFFSLENENWKFERLVTMTRKHLVTSSGKEAKKFRTCIIKYTTQVRTRESFKLEWSLIDMFRLIHRRKKEEKGSQLDFSCRKLCFSLFKALKCLVRIKLYNESEKNVSTHEHLFTHTLTNERVELFLTRNYMNFLDLLEFPLVLQNVNKLETRVESSSMTILINLLHLLQLNLEWKHIEKT